MKIDAERMLAVLGLHEDQKGKLETQLKGKFSRAVAGEKGTVREAEAMAVLYAAGVASDLREAELFRQLVYVNEEIKLPNCASPFQRDFYASFRSAIEDVQGRLPASFSPLYPLRFHRYSLDSHCSLSLQTSRSDADCYLSCYLLCKETKAVLLLPRKHYLAYKLQLQFPALCSGPADPRRQIYVRSRERDPPTVSKELHTRLRDTTLAMRQAEKAEMYAVQWIGTALSSPFLQEAADSLPMIRKEMEEIASELSKTAGNVLKSINAMLDSKHFCDNCSSQSSQKLPCGHYLCSPCLSSTLASADFTLKGLISPLICPKCTSTIPPASIAPAISAHLEALSQTSGLRYCSLCEHMHSLAAFPVLPCAHTVCGYCLRRRKERIDCEICREQEPVGICGACRRSLDYKNTAELTCTTIVDGKETANHGELCGRCSNVCYGHGLCVEERVLTASELDVIGKEVRIRLECCSKGFRSPSDLVATAVCGHVICAECTTSSQCPVCHEALLEKAVKELATCALCKRKQGEIELDCGHFLHKDCLPTLIDQCSCDNCARCPACNHYISPTSLLTQTSESLRSAFDAPFGYSIRGRCPQGTEYTQVQTELLQMTVQCSCHSLFSCLHCGLQDPPDGHPCTPFEQRKAVDVLLEQGKRAGQCPHCLQAQEVSWEQSYQQCQCGGYFAPCCCANYEEIWYHGAAWHRPNCVNYSDTPGVGACPHCPQGSSTCLKPAALQRHRLITHFEQNLRYL